MRKQLVSLAVAGSLGLGGAVLLVPGLANAATASPSASASSSATDRVAHRLAAITKALAGLVTDQTLTQAQADKVASTLAQRAPEGPGGPGRHRGHRPGMLSPEATASALGVTVADLRAGSEAGKTLAQIGATKGLSRDEVVSRLVAAAKTALASEVTAGRITQARADQVSADLPARLATRVDSVGGPRGDRPHGPDADDAPGTPPADAPATAAPSSSTGA